MQIAKARFQPHDRFAIGGETEMAGLDDPGVNGANRDLVQALALDRQEAVRLGRLGGLVGAQRMAQAPTAMI